MKYADALYPKFDGYPRPWSVTSSGGRRFHVSRQMAPFDQARPGMLMQPHTGPSGRVIYFPTRAAAQNRADKLNSN